jgi:hypothetical protein
MHFFCAVTSQKPKKLRFHAASSNKGQTVGKEFWDITPCGPVEVHRRFGGKNWLHFHFRRVSLESNSQESIGTLSDNEDGGKTSRRNVGERLPTILKSIWCSLALESSSCKCACYYAETVSYLWDGSFRGFWVPGTTEARNVKAPCFYHKDKKTLWYYNVMHFNNKTCSDNLRHKLFLKSCRHCNVTRGRTMRFILLKLQQFTASPPPSNKGITHLAWQGEQARHT